MSRELIDLEHGMNCPTGPDVRHNCSEHYFLEIIKIFGSISDCTNCIFRFTFFLGVLSTWKIKT